MPDEALIWWGGAVMGTPKSSPIIVTPIFWNPAGDGHPMSNDYKKIVTR